MARYADQSNPATIKRWRAEGRGKGSYATYKPWLTVNDVPSWGMSQRLISWTVGRQHDLLSELELRFALLADASPAVKDIREQYPLALEETLAIAARCALAHPGDRRTRRPIVMTTDFLLTLVVGSARTLRAIAIKPAEELSDRRMLEKLEIERRYWCARDVPWAIVTERELPLALTDNLAEIHQAHALDRELDPALLRAMAVQLTQRTQDGQTRLDAAAHACDLAYAQPLGTALRVAYHLIATRQWRVDLSRPLRPSHPLRLLDVALCAGAGGTAEGAL
jgi:TnsA endonuclease N terminal/TnsA endonuclease C terminal